MGPGAAIRGRAPDRAGRVRVAFGPVHPGAGEPVHDWRDLAACRGVDPDLFFPVGTTGPALEQVQQAKAVCATCPVARDCLRFAVSTGQEYGIWGGTTGEERRALAHRPRPTR